MVRPLSIVTKSGSVYFILETDDGIFLERDGKKNMVCDIPGNAPIEVPKSQNYKIMLKAFPEPEVGKPCEIKTVKGPMTTSTVVKVIR